MSASLDVFSHAMPGAYVQPSSDSDDLHAAIPAGLLKQQHWINCFLLQSTAVYFCFLFSFFIPLAAYARMFCRKLAASGL